MVQRVEIVVRVIVEMVVVTFSISKLPEVIVFVMGHVVNVVWTLCCGLARPRTLFSGRAYTAVTTIS